MQTHVRHVSCATIEGMITGLAHTGVCVPDCEAAVAYYRDVLGFTVLSPPYVMDGDAIRADIGELLADPSMKAPARPTRANARRTDLRRPGRDPEIAGGQGSPLPGRRDRGHRRREGQIRASILRAVWPAPDLR